MTGIFATTPERVNTEMLMKFSRCPLLISSILVIFADPVRCSDPQSVTCNMPSAVEGHKAELTCDFGVNMQDEGQRKEIFIQRQNSSGETETVAVCAMDGHPDYKCDQILPSPTRLDFSNITRYLTVGLSSVSQEDEGDYICRVSDVDRPTGKKCHFALKIPEVEEPISVGAVIGVVIGSIAVVAIVVILVIVCVVMNRKKKSEHSISLQKSPAAVTKLLPTEAAGNKETKDKGEMEN
ncbi:uncharacterized protein LOC143291637 isoform X2 [Babylonia areolata]